MDVEDGSAKRADRSLSGGAGPDNPSYRRRRRLQTEQSAVGGSAKRRSHWCTIARMAPRPPDSEWATALADDTQL